MGGRQHRGALPAGDDDRRGDGPQIRRARGRLPRRRARDERLPRHRLARGHRVRHRDVHVHRPERLRKGLRRRGAGPLPGGCHVRHRRHRLLHQAAARGRRDDDSRTLSETLRLASPLGGGRGDRARRVVEHGCVPSCRRRISHHRLRVQPEVPGDHDDRSAGRGGDLHDPRRDAVGAGDGLSPVRRDERRG